ncbi:MAG: hypothetical protein KA052_00820 [Candidatus Pacebacteria bacterium]|nr:hypothetical protein [Candidatus Paceibacterota bacterium]
MKIIGVCVLVSLCTLGGWYIGREGGIEKPVLQSHKSFLPEETIRSREVSDCSNKEQGYGCTIFVNGETHAGSCQNDANNALSCITN